MTDNKLTEEEMLAIEGWISRGNFELLKRLCAHRREECEALRAKIKEMEEEAKDREIEKDFRDD